MANVLKPLRSLMMIIVCINSIMIVASERFPVPQLQRKENNKKNSYFNGLSSLVSLGTFKYMVNSTGFPSVQRMVVNINISPVINVIHDNKRMLSIAVGAMGILLIAHRIQKSDRLKNWFSEKYITVSTFIGNKTQNFIENAPFPVRLAITPLQILAQFLSNCVVKYIRMNESTIVSSICSPVAGRLVDCVWTCPLPLVNFTSIGFAVSGGILAKGYFDQSFTEVNMKLNNLDQNNSSLHGATQKKIDEIKIEIKNVSKQIKNIDESVQSSKQCTDEIKIQTNNCNNKLIEITKNINSLDKKGDQQSLDLKSQSEELKNIRTEIDHLKKLLVEKDKERKQDFNAWEENHKKANKELRQEFQRAYAQLSSQVEVFKKELGHKVDEVKEKVKEEIKEGVKEFKECVRQQIYAFPFIEYCSTECQPQQKVKKNDFPLQIEGISKEALMQEIQKRNNS
jgi:hypothetical protein